MREMMLTGRSNGAEEGLALGVCYYAVGAGEGMELAQTRARKAAENAPFSNYQMLQSLARIQDMSRSDEFFAESLAAAMAQNSDGAKEGLRTFLERRLPKFR